MKLLLFDWMAMVSGLRSSFFAGKVSRRGVPFRAFTKARNFGAPVLPILSYLFYIFLFCYLMLIWLLRLLNSR